MGVRRFPSFEAARRDLWLPSGHPDIPRRMKRLAELAATRPVVPGVTRFRSIEDAEAWKAGARAG